MNNNFWTDGKVIDFVNWYIKLHKLDFKYSLENQRIIDSFKNGDDAEDWHIIPVLKISTKNYGDDEIGLTSEQISEL